MAARRTRSKTTLRRSTSVTTRVCGTTRGRRSTNIAIKVFRKAASSSNFGAPGFHPGGERPRYNPEFFPRIFHPQERFEWRGGHWRGPPGWYYRTWYYGQILPWGWFDEGYWISDYWFYDLPVPPYGYEWVRNGPDALLVDLRSGMIVEVVPGIFY